MKTINKTKIILILLAVLGFQINTIFASATPKVAMDNDGAPDTEINIGILAPVTPWEADFEEVSNQNMTSLNDILAPVTPVTADFDDEI
ncbi:MAG: hypothetical protein NT004_07030 [Bacteroidetes bacterium]|nr:hypothetical protein [Bacteroidota bacterium]